MPMQFLLNYETDTEISELFGEATGRFADSPCVSLIRTGDVYPGHIVPVYRSEQGVFQADLMQWGYPKFQGKGLIFNARSETAPEKTMFKSSIPQKRCAVLASGFYAWHSVDADEKKQRYLVTARDKPHICMAGLFRACHWAKDDLPLQRFVVLTAPASGPVSRFCERVPLLLSAETMALWLNDTQFALYLLHSGSEDIPLQAVPV